MALKLPEIPKFPLVPGDKQLYSVCPFAGCRKISKDENVIHQHMLDIHYRDARGNQLLANRNVLQRNPALNPVTPRIIA